MINGFHMNPLWFLAMIPIIPIYILGSISMGLSYYGLIIFLIIWLMLLIYLCSINVIGAMDAILLFIILIVSYEPFRLGPISAIISTLLIPLAMTMSYNSQK